MVKNLLKYLKINYGKLSLILTLIGVVLLASDLITKHLEEAYNWNFWHDVDALNWLIFVESGHRNPGAAFSFLANAEWGQAFLITLTVIMLIVLIAVFIFMPERFALLKVALVLIISGALGNLVDRIAFGEVRDFVWINIFGSFACCNFADFWIVIGAIIAGIDVLFLNEFSLIPLTKKAQEAQKAERQAQLLNAQNKIDADISANEQENSANITKEE